MTFPNVANPWDLSNAPYLYFRVDSLNTSQSTIFRVRLTHRWTSKMDVAPTSAADNQVPDPAAYRSTMLRNMMYEQSEYVSGTVSSMANYFTSINNLDVFFEPSTPNQLTVWTDVAQMALTLLDISELSAGGDQPVSHYANSIIGASGTITVGPYTLPQTFAKTVLPFPVNLTGMLHVYLTSTILTATARSLRPMFAPVENCVLAIPVASTYLTLVDHRPEAPTIWDCNQNNNWDVVDFQLRYDTGGIVDLGGNDIEIEVEFEVMEQFNPPIRQMKEAIYMPYVNTHDTTKLLLKRDNRSWGSFTGNTGSRQFSAAGYTSRVFR